MNINTTQPKIQPVETTKIQRRIILFVVALALMMVVSAVSGLNVALPDIAKATGASQTQLQWIVDAYTMVFAGLLLFAGALGDRYGRKGILQCGLAIFGLSAATAMFVDSPEVLIWLRAVMGIGAALVMPTTLSIITTSFPKEERGKAVGVWVGMAGGGAVIGLFGAGILLEFFNWSSFFVLNVVLAILASVGTKLVIPRSKDVHAPKLDIPGALLSLLMIVGLIVGIIEGPERGWSSPLVVSSLVGSMLALVAFIFVGRKTKDPLLDPRLFKLRGFSTGTISIVVQFFSAFGFFFIIMQYLQYILDYSPLKAACTMLPLPLVLLPLARRAPMLAEKYGINRIAGIGLFSMAAACFVFSFLGLSMNYALLLSGLVLFAIGMAFAGAPATTAVISSLPSSKQGVASAVNDVSREFGSALGIALLGSVLNSAYRSNMQSVLHGLPTQFVEQAEKSIVFVKHAPLERLGSQSERILHAAQQAYLNASGKAFLTAAAILTITSIFVALRAPKKADQQ